MTKILFLDRDGIINKDIGYTVIWDENLIYEEMVNILLCYQKRNYSLFIVTNQSGIGRGYYDEDKFHSFMKSMIEFFAVRGVFIDGYDFCPHRPDELCICRKPKPTMIIRKLIKSGCRPDNCIMVGDKLSDVIAGRSAGITCNILVSNPEELVTMTPTEEIYVSHKQWLSALEVCN